MGKKRAQPGPLGADRGLMTLMPSLRARIRDEQSGFTLIEVMVSALLVVILSVGVLKALDAAEASSGGNKARGTAANLAQQDQERLRSFRAKELSNARETRTRTVAGVVYTIVSRSDWVSDASGSKSCNGASARADYMKINSTVTWPDMRGAKPVSTNSVVAAPSGSFGDEGSLGVQVLNRSGVGQAAVTVIVTGPKNLSDTTDANGCVFFGYLPEGNYTVTFSKAGHVDANGVTNVSRVIGVQNETTQVQTIDYDLAAGMTVNAQTAAAPATRSSPRPSATSRSATPTSPRPATGCSATAPPWPASPPPTSSRSPAPTRSTAATAPGNNPHGAARRHGCPTGHAALPGLEPGRSRSVSPPCG